MHEINEICEEIYYVTKIVSECLIQLSTDEIMFYLFIYLIRHCEHSKAGE